MLIARIRYLVAISHVNQSKDDAEALNPSPTTYPSAERIREAILSSTTTLLHARMRTRLKRQKIKGLSAQRSLLKA